MSEKNKKYLALVLLIALFLLVRLSILVFSPYPKFNDGEERYNAHAALTLLEGGYPFRLFDYQIAEYMGGRLVAILMTTLSFLLCGANHFTFRISPLFVGTVEIVLFYLFLHRYFNRRVAVYSSLLLILSPLPFLYWSLKWFGDHKESTVFFAATAFIFYRIFFDGQKKKLNFILLGIIAGFAAYYCYIYLITLAWLMLLWFIFDKGFFLRKGFLLFAISFLVGFSPGIYLEITYNFWGLKWFGQFLETGGLNVGSHSFVPNFNMLLKVKTFLGPYLISALRFRNTASLNGWFLGAVYYSIFVVSFLTVAWNNRKVLGKLLSGLFSIRRPKISARELPPESPLFIYMGIFVFSFLVSRGTNYISDLKPWKDLLLTSEYLGYYYRYLMPFYIFIFIFISIFLDKLWRKKNWLLKLISFLLLTILISINLIGNVNSFEINFSKPINKAIPFQKDKTFFYRDIIGAVLCRLPQREIAKMAYKIKPEERDDFYLALGMHLSGMFKRRHKNFIRIVMDTEPIYRKYLYEGIGRTFGRSRSCDFYKNIDTYLPLINGIDPEYRCYFYNRPKVSHIGELLSAPNNQIDKIDPQYRGCFYRGLGHSLEWGFGKDIDTHIQIIDKIPPEYRGYFYQGLGYRLNWRFGKDFSSYIKMADQVRPEYRKYFYQGLGLSLDWIFGRDISTYIQEINKIPPECKGYFYQGLGRNTYWRLGRDINAYVQMANRIEHKYRGYFYRGWVSGDICLVFGDSPEEYIKLIKNIDNRYRHFIYQGIKFGLNHQSMKTREEYFDTKDVGKLILYDLLENLDQAILIAPKKELNIARVVTRIGEDKRLAIFVPFDSEILYNLSLDEKSVLSFGIGVPEELWKKGNTFLACISIISDGNKDRIFSEYLNPGEGSKHRKWFDYEIDLSGYTGKKVILSLETYPGSSSNSDHDHIPGGLCWAYPQINRISKDNF